MISLYLVLAFSAFAASLDKNVITNHTEGCKRSSQELNKCLKSALQNVITDLSKENIPADERIDPWLMPEIPLSFGTAAERMGITIGEEKLFGLSETKIKGVRANFKDKSKLRLEIELLIRRLNLQGNFSAEVVGLEPQRAAEGDFNVTILGIKGMLVLKGHVVERSGGEYVTIDRASLRPQIADIHIDIANANDPYPELTEIVTSMVNQYWRLVYAEAIPFIEEGLDAIIRSYLDESLAEVTFDKILPE